MLIETSRLASTQKLCRFYFLVDHGGIVRISTARAYAIHLPILSSISHHSSISISFQQGAYFHVELGFLLPYLLRPDWIALESRKKKEKIGERAECLNTRDVLEILLSGMTEIPWSENFLVCQPNDQQWISHLCYSSISPGSGWSLNDHLVIPIIKGLCYQDKPPCPDQESLL